MTYFAYLDEFGHIGPYVSRTDPRYKESPVFGLAASSYWDDYKDDDFRRLHYLSLWQSLSESRKKLGYTPPAQRPDSRRTLRSLEAH